MRKFIFRPTLIIVGIYFFVSSMQIFSQSPYAIFGDDTPVLGDDKMDFTPIVSSNINIPPYNCASDSDLIKVFLPYLHILFGDSMVFYNIDDQAIALFVSEDPKSHEFTSVSPFVFCLSNPVNLIDPDGRSPIYSPAGDFLGVDENGFIGPPIVMNRIDYFPGMPSSTAQSSSIRKNSLPTEVIKKIDDHYLDLPSRPDYDGELTLREANRWYRSFRGEELYVDIRRLDLSKVDWHDRKDGDERTFNLLTSARANYKQGLVYGNITLLANPDGTVSALPDKYDFDMHSWEKPKNWIRNIETIIGAIVARSGKSYIIIFYNRTQISNGKN